MISRTIVNSLTSRFDPRSTVSLTGGVGLAAHLVDRFLERKALDRRVVDAGDQIAGHHAGARRRRIVDRAHHLDQPALHHHFEAKAAEFLALHAALEVLQGLGIEIVRMRVERRQHAVDRRLDHFLVVGLLGVIVAHFVEHFGKERELVVRAGAGGAQRIVRGADQHNAGGDSIGKIGETFPHRRTLSSIVRVERINSAWRESSGPGRSAPGTLPAPRADRSSPGPHRPSPPDPGA